MTPQVSQWDQSRFNDALRVYALFNKRTIPQIVNAKIFYIGRKAIRFTRKTDLATIDRELGQKVVTRSDRFKKDGTLSKVKKRTVTWTLTQARTRPVPLAWLLVSRGGGLPRAEVDAAAKTLIGARRRSVAYLRAGWLSAILDVKPYVVDEKKTPPRSDVALWSTRRHGKGFPAKEATGLVVARIHNDAGDTPKRAAALIKYGTPALASAFQDETASMIAYVEKKLASGTATANKMLA